MKAAIFTLATLLVLLVSGCASIPTVRDPSGVDLTVTELNEQGVMTYYGQGGPFEPNPYLPSSSLLGGQPYDYIVLRVEVVAARAASLALVGATARDVNGAIAARAYSERQLLALLRRGSLDDRLYNELALKVEQSYLPERGAEVRPGRRSFAVVLVGRHPVPDAVTIDVRMEVENDTLRAFELDRPR